MSVTHSVPAPGIDVAALSERARALLRFSDLSRSPRVHASLHRTASLLAWTLLVLPGPRWLRFIDHVGMLGASPALRRVLSGRRVALWREQLGQDLYLFGLQQAPLMGSFAVAPERFDTTEGIDSVVRGTGIEALVAFCHSPHLEDTALRRRLADRIDDIGLSPVHAAPVEAPHAALLQRVLRYTEPILSTALIHPEDTAP